MSIADRQALAELMIHLGADRVITDPVQLITYEIDAGLDRGRPDAVVLPRDIDDVTRLVRWAARHGIPLVARGAGTGLAGGAVAEHGGLVVQLGLLNRVLDLDVAGRSATVEAGVVNLTLDAQARAQGLFFPPDPSSQRSSTIGGNIGNNAGGPHCFKYGVTTNSVGGVEAVLADGRLARFGGRAFDYPEYDLTAIFVGSEGTLGIVTRAELRLQRDPPAVRTLLAAFDSIERAGVAVSAIIARGLVPATMEMMDDRITRIIEEYAHPGLPLDAGAVLIVEVDGYPASVGPQIAEIETILRDHGAHELRVAQSAAERDRIWFGRKSAAGAMARLAPAFYLVDGTVPRSKLAPSLAAINQILAENELRVGHVFHAGDGNLHPLILVDDPSDPALIARVLDAGRRILEVCIAAGGSITGEHGVGIEKRAFMPLMYDPAELALMWDIKDLFDPAGIMNPGKVLPPRVRHDHPRVVATEVPGAGETGEQSDAVWDQIAATALPAVSAGSADLLTPASADEAAALLRRSISERQSVRIRGGGSKSALHPPADMLLSTERLAGIAALQPADLYVTVGAGTRLAELQTELAREGMWVPLASPWPAATIGGIIAANLNAPLRMRYGGARDLLLAATVAHPNGRVTRLGRPVVKNVAGYDLPRLHVGAYGTLGLLCDLTFKLAPLPRARATLIALPQRVAHSLAISAKLLRQSLAASAVLTLKLADTERWMPAIPLAPARHSATMLVYSAEGLAEDVAAELAAARAILRDAGVPAIQLTEPAGSDLWAGFVGNAQPDELLVRVGVAPKDVGALLQRAGLAGSESYMADLAAGQIYLRAPAPRPEDAAALLTRLRQAARMLGGYAIALAAPARARLDPWGHTPDALDLMQTLRRRWGADGLLNPGAFIV